MALPRSILIVAAVLLASTSGVVAQVSAPCDLTALADVPEVFTVTNFHGLEMVGAGPTPVGPWQSTLHQGYNYPEPLGQGQQRVLFNSASPLSGALGCARTGVPGVDWFSSPDHVFNSAMDGTRPELAAISENYVKIYVNNAGRSVAPTIPSAATTTKSTIYYSLCSVATNGTETCPSNFLTLGEFTVTENPFIHITGIADGEYNLKVYSNVTTCTNCPTPRSDSATPLEIPFVVITSAPSVTITSTDMPYINADTRSSHIHFQSNIPSRFSGKNSDTAYQSPTQTANPQDTTTLAVYHTLFQVKLPWDSSNWRDPFPDNDDGKGMQWLNIPVDAAQGEYTVEVLTMLVSNYSTPLTQCASAACSSDCPSMCLSDFSNIGTYNRTKHAHAVYAAAPATRTFIYDTIPPVVQATCRTGDGKCSGVLYSKKSMSFSFTCTDSNSPCTFYCAIDGKPTLDPSAAAALPKGYTPCTSPAAVHAKASGSNTFTVYAVDAAGNRGEVSDPYTFYTDNTAPEVSFGGIAKSCLLDERYFIPDLHSDGPASDSSVATSTGIPANKGGRCVPDGAAGVTYGSSGTNTRPDTSIEGQYGSSTCTCGAYSIETSATEKVFAYNQGTYPSLMSADSDTSLNAYLGYYPKTVPDQGLQRVGQKLTGKQYLVDGFTEIDDTDGDFDFSTDNAGEQSQGYMLYDVGTAANTTDDISSTNGMYDTVVQVDMDITREVYNLPSGKYGAVLATKKVNGNYYYHVLAATNSPNARMNMVCKHPEIKNCIQTPQNPFQMDCGMLI